MRLWFVTPAYQRFALAEVCFDQWKQISAALAAHGVEFRAVIVSDDENLEIARAAGFDTVEQDNDWLGRRFNDGYEYACRNGADWVTGVGSDSWIHPDYLWPLPDPDVARHSRNLTVITSTKMAELWVTLNGATPYLFHRSLLEPISFRPAEDRIRRGCDSSTIVGIEYARGRRIDWEERNLGAAQHISFRAKPHLTKYTRLWAAYGQRETYDPFGFLAEHFDAELVERARHAIAGELVGAAA